MLKLILADNQAIFRAGIAKVLAVEDEMRIVAQAQTPEQMFMALDKFRAAVLVIAGGFHSDFNAILQAASRNKTRVVVLADTGESAQRYINRRPRGGLSQRDQRLAGGLRPQSGAWRELGAGYRGSERADRERYGWTAGARPAYRQRTAHRRLDRSGLQEQRNRLAAGNDGAGDQELSA